MLSSECLQELRSAWLPNMTDAGLDRVIELLERASPLLIHGCFTRAIPMGCLATHIAWNHPRTEHLTQDAGIMWLHHVARLNPATSQVLREWDRCGVRDLNIRQDLLAFLAEEKQRRQEAPAPAERVSLVEVG
jgi:hypothetical protein